MKILGLNKSGYYYKPRDPKPDEAEICAAIDCEHLDLFFLFSYRIGIGTHSNARFSVCVPLSQASQKRIRETFCLDGGSGLPVLQTRKPTDNTLSISAFSSNTEEIVQISVHLKSKNALYYVVNL